MAPSRLVIIYMHVKTEKSIMDHNWDLIDSDIGFFFCLDPALYQPLCDSQNCLSVIYITKCHHCRIRALLFPSPRHDRNSLHHVWRRCS